MFQTIIHLFNKHLLSTYFVPLPVLGPRVWAGGNISLCSSVFCSRGVRGGGKRVNTISPTGLRATEEQYREGGKRVPVLF